MVRALRQERRWRQADLGRRAGVGRTVVSEIELGRASEHRLGTLRAVSGALGGRLDVSIRGVDARAERLLDERHARLVGTTAAWLKRVGWTVEAEVSYSEWGERGSIDLLASHPRVGALLVVEVKSELISVEATLRKHDEKVRLARIIAERRSGGRVANVARLLVLPEESRQRRLVAAHAAVLDLAYPERGRAVRSWCRRPCGPMSGLLFSSYAAPGGSARSAGTRERVRRPDRSPAERGSRPGPGPTPRRRSPDGRSAADGGR
jgi:transcriptional regulator with XRE-family HTH domain